ncbi:MAG: PDZ domain-containing protein [Candidatus Eisenbacteria bacterium]
MFRGTAALLSVLAASLLCVSAATAVEPHAGMLRYPDVSATHIAFRYANDIWLVPREGGAAAPLSSSPGGESFPRFSPDGRTIAFSASYDGVRDLYVLPVSGGVPKRVTHHPSQELLSDWTPDGELIFYGWYMGNHPHAPQLFTVPPTGGLPERLPVPYGRNAVVSDDGTWLAYNPFSTDFSTWKRYMGGRAPDVWLLNLKDHTSKRITDWDGADSIPMWNGESLYYVSDSGPNHLRNIWVYDMETGDRRQVTKHKDHDVKWPSIGPGDRGQGEIVYQLGSELRLLDLATEESRVVRVTIPGDRPRLRPQSVDAAGFIDGYGISATGKRAVVEARGDVWTLPAESGSPLNLTRTDGVAERDPSWSPDGQWIAFFSDRSGEYELHIAQSDGRGSEKQVTSLKAGFLFAPVWSPDSEKIAFKDQRGAMYIHDVEKDRTKEIYKSPVGSWAPRVSWSHDSNWITFAADATIRSLSSVWLYDLAEGKLRAVTSGMFADTWPVFDREGEYLFFASNRDFSSPTYDAVGENWAYAQTDQLFAVALRDTIASPFLPESDEEEWDGEDADDEGEDEDADDGGDADDEDEDGDAEDADAEDEEPLRIDLEGFERRAILLPIESGAFFNLAVNADGVLFYQRRSEDGEGAVYLADFDDEDEMEKEVLSGVNWFDISADGNKLLAVGPGSAAIVDAAEGQSWDESVSTAGMNAEVDPRDEWAQILRDAWRIHRDFFYAPNMHGLDWDGVYRKYEAMLGDCASRADLSYVIQELIAELNVGHAYYFGGDYEDAPNVSVGMLGCDYELHDGAYRIARIYEGGAWDADARGPLSERGMDVAVGDYLLAVNGVPVDATKDPWAAFQGLAGQTVTLTVSAGPEIDDEARYVVVEPIGGEYDLKYRAWVEDRRAYVDRMTDGRVGYVYVPDTGVNGQNELVRQFYGNATRDALIVDERWNGGGQIPTRFVELLNRPLASYWTMRHADQVAPTPGYAHYGPKCMIINESAGSGGDYFPYWFKEAGVGKLVGTRTWGGLVGLSGNPGLIDGGYTSVPRFAFFNKDGTWGIEGHGVDPDIEVVDDPALMWDGGDPQLDAAIRLMLEELKTGGYQPPKRPPYPDRSGMGIPISDH